jgi:hypothetical protein
MRKIYIILILFISPGYLLAGTNEKAGSAGATELLINPWARSSGFGGINTSGVKGIEALNTNAGGLAATKKTEIAFSRTNWLQGSDIHINAFGISQRVGQSGVLGVAISSMDFGDIETTTGDKPEGGIGTYSPQLLNFSVAYGKEFSNSIRAGLVVRGVQESTADMKATGFCFDAGIQYNSGDKEEIKFGIALRNVGPAMKYSGDGLNYDFTDPKTNRSYEANKKAQGFEIPSLLNIGVSYDFYFATAHRLTAIGNFTSNSFSNDLIGFGGEYGFKKFLMIRGAYNIEKDNLYQSKTPSVYNGVSFGGTFEVPLNDKGTTFGIDYSYRVSHVFDGTHSFGARITL